MFFWANRHRQPPQLYSAIPRRRRRRRLRREVYLGLFGISLLIYHNFQLRTFMDGFLMMESSSVTVQKERVNTHPTIIHTAHIPGSNPNAVFLRESRKSFNFSEFVPTISNSSIAETTMEEARKGRERIISILEHDLGIQKLTIPEIMTLPTWNQIEELYGDKPIILGLDSCRKFQEVPLARRHIGVAGIFNSGTTAFGLSLQANCRYPNRAATDAAHSNDVVTNVHGMLNQVPWAKHKMAQERNSHTILDSIQKDHVLPVVLVRDPYYWLQSMCRQGYGVRWDHNSKQHCPNLVPNDFDRQRFPKLQNASTVPVWMGASRTTGPNWDSLVHYWNDWYSSYYNNDERFPRLLIRFEDTLYHSKQVMKTVCQCGGGIYSGNEDEEDSFRPVVDEAKWSHKHSQNNLVSAIIKYGTNASRYDQMTLEDLEFAKHAWDNDLIEAFHYKRD